MNGIVAQRVKGKRTMTPDMLDKLRLAREKAAQVKKELTAGGNVAKIEHLNKKLQKLKPPSAEGDSPFQTPNEVQIGIKRGTPSKEPEVKLEIKPVLEESGSEEEEEPVVVKKPKKAKKPKKPVVVVEESSSSSSDDESSNVIYIKKKSKNSKYQKIVIPKPQPAPIIQTPVVLPTYSAPTPQFKAPVSRFIPNRRF